MPGCLARCVAFKLRNLWDFAGELAQCAKRELNRERRRTARSGRPPEPAPYGATRRRALPAPSAAPELHSNRLGQHLCLRGRTLARSTEQRSFFHAVLSSFQSSCVSDSFFASLARSSTLPSSSSSSICTRTRYVTEDDFVNTPDVSAQNRRRVRVLTRGSQRAGFGAERSRRKSRASKRDPRTRPADTASRARPRPR